MLKTVDGIVLMQIPESPSNDYMAGSDGMIYSRKKYKGFGRKDYVDWYPLRGRKTKKGYLSVSLCHQNKKITKNVHRLICSAFHGAPTIKTLQVRHLDGNPSNNQPSNLAWGTQEENWLDRQAHGNGVKGEKHPLAKLDNFGRKAVRWAVNSGLCSQYHAARMLGMSQAGISSIIRGSED